VEPIHIRTVGGNVSEESRKSSINSVIPSNSFQNFSRIALQDLRLGAIKVLAVQKSEKMLGNFRQK